MLLACINKIICYYTVSRIRRDGIWGRGWFIPFSPLQLKSSPSSLLHMTYGSGYPDALHTSVRLLASLTTRSVEVFSSMMTGGTDKKMVFFMKISHLQKRNERERDKTTRQRHNARPIQFSHWSLRVIFHTKKVD